MNTRFATTIAIVGTDTAIGKTTIARGIAAILARQHTVAAFKPAETGCLKTPQGLFASDAHLLMSAAGTVLDPNLVIPYRFALPASPLAAALHSHTQIDRAHLLHCHRQLASTHDHVLMEGAGGLLVPYGPDWTFADLLEDIRPAIIVVARSSLGTINHTLLTLAELRRRNLNVVGVILNQVLPNKGAEEDSTPASIAAFAHIRILGIIPHLNASFHTNEIAHAIASHADLSDFS